MTYHVQFQFNTSLDSRRLSSYRVTISEGSDECLPMEQTGPVCNSILHKSGIFATLHEACKSAADEIKLPIKIFAVFNAAVNEKPFYQIVSRDAKPPHDVAVTSRVVFSRGPSGDFYGLA